jgi:hypothetical protein
MATTSTATPTSAAPAKWASAVTRGLAHLVAAAVALPRTLTTTGRSRRSLETAQRLATNASDPDLAPAELKLRRRGTSPARRRRPPGRRGFRAFRGDTAGSTRTAIDSRSGTTASTRRGSTIRRRPRSTVRMTSARACPASSSITWSTTPSWLPSVETRSNPSQRHNQYASTGLPRPASAFAPHRLAGRSNLGFPRTPELQTSPGQTRPAPDHHGECEQEPASCRLLLLIR